MLTTWPFEARASFSATPMLLLWPLVSTRPGSPSLQGGRPVLFTRELRVFGTRRRPKQAPRSSGTGEASTLSALPELRTACSGLHKPHDRQADGVTNTWNSPHKKPARALPLGGTYKSPTRSIPSCCSSQPSSEIDPLPTVCSCRSILLHRKRAKTLPVC